MAKKKTKDEPKPAQVSDKEFFDVYEKQFLSDPNYHKLFEVTAKRAKDLLNPQSFLDLGAGPGQFVHEMQKLGVQSSGLEGNTHFLNYFAESNKKGILELKDITEAGAITEPVDLIASIEVFEHIPEEQLRANLLPSIAANCKHFLFSSTPNRTDWDAAWGHINIKSRAEWIVLFAEYGLAYFADMELPTTWTLVFTGGLK